MNINNLQEAVEYFIKHFCKDGKVVDTFLGGKGSPICRVVKCGTKLNYVVRNDNWLNLFNKIFPLTASDKGVGQTFDMRIVQEANKENGVIISVMTDCSVYAIDGTVAYKYVINKNTIRTPSTNKLEQGSVPKKYLVSLQPNETL